jgi:diadenylate cyclase
VGGFQLGFGDFFQIAILAVAIYFLFNLFRGTRSAQMLFGLTLVLLGLIALTMVFKFEVLGWLLRKLPIFMVFALVVIFQPEIRQALAIIGRRRSALGRGAAGATTRIDHLVAAAEEMARGRIGALIAIEREISLDGYRQSGTSLNAPLVPKLLTSIFFPRGPLHDGGVIIRGNTILAARCIFPLQTADSSLSYGMRHRAALGLSEETDAFVIVVSEERGAISLAFQGRLLQNLTGTRLARYLMALSPREGFLDAWRRILDQFDLDGERGAGSEAAERREPQEEARRA